MKRFFIFAMFFPLLTLLAFIAHDMVGRHDLPGLELLFFMLGWAYLIAGVPGCAAAFTDWSLSAKPFYLRLSATMIAAAIFGILTARYLGQRELVRTIDFIGVIPAGICSWLASKLDASST